MKLWMQTTLLAASLLILSGCASTPIPKKEAVIDATLPIVVLTQNGTIADMNAIAFEWQSIKDPRVNGVYIYKLAPNSQDKTPSYYATVNNRFTTHFTDSQVSPDTQYTYYFKTFSKDAESQKSNNIVVDSLPLMESVAWISSIQDMPRSAKIIWRPHTNQIVKAYVVERKSLQDTEWKKIAEVNGRLSAEYIDNDLKDKSIYHYRLRALTYDNILSSPSVNVKIVTKALPQGVENITTTTDLPKKIQIEWSKSKAEDFYRYFIYRSPRADSGYELIAKLYNNLFVDKIEEDGKQYFYKVSVVDKDGLESKDDESFIAGLTLVKPNPPALVDARWIDNKIKLVWSKTDPRTNKYRVVRKYKTGWFDEINEEFAVGANKEFIDSRLAPNTTYFYTIYGLDTYSIRSTPSVVVEIKSKELPLNSSNKDTQKEETVIPLKAQEIESGEIITPTQDFKLNEI
ncbi:hypothetical protein KKG72_00615 [bacterium]|nr:hypothetical protein [bacterium]